MVRFNLGQLYTNENCIGCNKCVSSCPVLGANVSVFHRNYNAGLKEGYHTIQVNSKKCCNCGECLTACTHKARSFNDDSAAFLLSLNGSARYSLIVDSALFAGFSEELSRIFGFLKEKGVERIYSTSLGKEIAVWGNVNYVKNQKEERLPKKAFITNNCSAFGNNVELYHPFLVSNIIPFQSDFMCTAIYARKYLNDDNQFAYLSPCTAIKNDCSFHDKDKIITFKLLFSKLLPLIKKNLSVEKTAAVDYDSVGLNKIVPVIEDSLVSYRYFFNPSEKLKQYEGLKKEVFSELNSLNQLPSEKLRPVIAAFSACKKGCCYGPGIPSEEIKEDGNKVELYLNDQIYNSFRKYTNQNDYEKNLSDMNQLFEKIGLKKEDFDVKITRRFHQNHQIPDYAYEAVYKAMRKTSESKRHIDCGSCGYSSCREMAQAIAYGYNKKENCIHYMNEEMESRYSIDPQTGILNRNAFVAKATNLLLSNPDKRYFICSGDINKFKIINELYGSTAGDEVLKSIAAKLSEITGSQGVCGRFNGGNFILCLEAGPENMNRLRQIKQFDVETIDFPVTMRFGIYITQSEHENLQETMNWAAMARDENKEKTTFQNEFVLFTDELKKRIDDEGRITSLMKTALEEKEFQIYFQPQYETATGNLVGAEVLCRWFRKNGETVMPGRFIPVAEKNGYIKRLDNYIWDMAFSTMRRWLDKNYNVVPLSVNISRLTMFDERFVYEIKHLFSKYNIPEDLIHFELTESAVTKDNDKLLERLNQLKSQCNVKVAMDDFGSGYSSLNTLKEMPIDILKLDMGFLRSGEKGTEIGEKGGNIISSVVHMAQNIDIVTIAEGVEYENQLRYLKGLGCNIIQGFIFARPMPESDFIKAMEEKTKKIPLNQQDEESKIRKAEVLFELYNPNSVENQFFEKYAGPAGIFVYDDIQNTLDLERCNEKALNLLGFSSLPIGEVRSILGKYFNGNSKNELVNAVVKAIQTNEETVCFTENTKYKTEIPIYLKENIWEVGKKGNIHTLYILLTDVTSEKISEDTIKSFMRNAVLPQAYVNFRFNPEKLKETIHLRFVKVNPEFEKLFGFASEEILNWTEKDVMKMIYPEDLPGFMKNALKSIYHNPENTFVYEFRTSVKTPSETDMAYSKVKILLEGKRMKDNSYNLVADFFLLKDDGC